MMKKIIFLLISILLAGSLLQCSSQKSEDEKTLQTLLEKLCTVPNTDFLKVYNESERSVEDAGTSDREPGIYSVGSFRDKIDELYGSYFRMRD